MADSANWGKVTLCPTIRDEVAIIGVGESEHSANSGREAVDIAAQAIENALRDAGLEPDQVDGLMVQQGIPDQFTEQDYHRHFGTRHKLWVSQEGGAMTWAATAPAAAARAMADGKARNIVNVFATNWASQSKAGTGGPGDFHRSEQMKANLEVPFGWYPQPVYFATTARRYQHEYQLNDEALGHIAVTSRRHANTHPGAVMRDKTLSLDDYLARKPFIDPLRLEDCCLISDGGAAYVMTDIASARRQHRQRAVSVMGVAEAYSHSGFHFALQSNYTATPQVFCAPAAFKEAGINAAEVDVLTVYDPFTIVALMQIEDMGFCKKGSAGDFVNDERLYYRNNRHRGGLPFNTHGGLLSHAYVLGIAHVVELVRQLRGEAANQVEDARIGVYGGYTGGSASTLVLKAGVL